MASEKAELLLHPIRLRIVLAMTGSELTTAELQERLPDVAPATLYRQVAMLVRAGLLEVVAEEQKRGSVERTYRLVESAASLGAEDASSMSREEHLSGFIAFTGALIQAFGRYLDGSDSNPAADNVSYRQVGLWVTPEELQRLADAFGGLIGPYLENRPAPGRSKVSLSTILIPEVS